MTSLQLIDSNPREIQPTFSPLPSTLHHAPIEALYLHIPFCSSKCHYCDFYSLAGHLDRATPFLTALETEMRLHREHFGQPAPRTIFIGGGTPTLLSPEHLERLLTSLHNFINPKNLIEFTIEANPNTFDPVKAAILRRFGVYRISFGAQSFNPTELATLQRDHDPDSVPRAFEIARHANITNLNLDLIFGIPGQTLASWDYSLTRALALHPSHLSCYSLIYEPNTAMTARMKHGEFQPIDESLELELFNHTYSRLRGSGFTRYETSNYARIAEPHVTPQNECHASVPKSMPHVSSHPIASPPLACQHNLNYWKATNWLGLGPSAGSHFSSIQNQKSKIKNESAHQWKNISNLTHYLSALDPPTPHLPITQLESLPHNKWIAQSAIFWLRLTEGLSFADFEARTGTNPKLTLTRTLTPFIEQGFCEITPTHARILEKGVAVSNHILTRVLAALESEH